MKLLLLTALLAVSFAQDSTYTGTTSGNGDFSSFTPTFASPTANLIISADGTYNVSTGSTSTRPTAASLVLGSDTGASFPTLTISDNQAFAITGTATLKGGARIFIGSGASLTLNTLAVAGSAIITFADSTSTLLLTTTNIAAGITLTINGNGTATLGAINNNGVVRLESVVTASTLTTFNGDGQYIITGTLQTSSAVVLGTAGLSNILLSNGASLKAQAMQTASFTFNSEVTIQTGEVQATAKLVFLAGVKVLGTLRASAVQFGSLVSAAVQSAVTFASGARLYVNATATFGANVTVNIVSGALFDLENAAVSFQGAVIVQGQGALNLVGSTVNTGVASTVSLAVQVNTSATTTFTGLGTFVLGTGFSIVGNATATINNLVINAGQVATLAANTVITTAAQINGTLIVTGSATFQAGLNLAAGANVTASSTANVVIGGASSSVAAGATLSLRLVTFTQQATVNVAAGAVVDIRNAVANAASTLTFAGQGVVELANTTFNSSVTFTSTILIAGDVTLQGAANAVLTFAGAINNTASGNIEGSVSFVAGSSINGTSIGGLIFLNETTFASNVNAQGSATTNTNIFISSGAIFQGGLTIGSGSNVTIDDIVFIYDDLTVGANAFVSATADAGVQLQDVANATIETGAEFSLTLAYTVGNCSINLVGTAILSIGQTLNVTAGRLTLIGDGLFDITSAKLNVVSSSSLSIGAGVTMSVDASTTTSTDSAGSTSSSSSSFIEVSGELVTTASANAVLGGNYVFYGNSTISNNVGDSASGTATISFSSFVSFQNFAYVSVAIKTGVSVNSAVIRSNVTVATSGTSQFLVNGQLTLQQQASYLATETSQLVLNTGSILYAQGSASIAQSAEFVIRTNATLYSAVGATLLINASVSVTATGNSAANFFGTIVINANLVVAAGANMVISGVGSVVQTINADLSQAGQFAIFAAQGANNTATSSVLKASGSIKFGGAASINVCASLSNSIQTIILAQYTTHSGFFATLAFNQNLAAAVCTSAGVEVNTNSKRADANGYTVEYSDSEAVARRTSAASTSTGATGGEESDSPASKAMVACGLIAAAALFA